MFDIIRKLEHVTTFLRIVPISWQSAASLYEIDEWSMRFQAMRTKKFVDLFVLLLVVTTTAGCGSYMERTAYGARVQQLRLENEYRQLLIEQLRREQAAEGQQSELMESWIGQHQSDLIASWGPPQQTIDDGEGGRILVYTTTRSYASPGSATTSVSESPSGGSARTTYDPPRTVSFTTDRMFWIGPTGHVERWAVRDR